jgi:hypothetical protein
MGPFLVEQKLGNLPLVVITRMYQQSATVVVGGRTFQEEGGRWGGGGGAGPRECEERVFGLGILTNELVQGALPCRVIETVVPRGRKGRMEVGREGGREDGREGGGEGGREEGHCTRWEVLGRERFNRTPQISSKATRGASISLCSASEACLHQG